MMATIGTSPVPLAVWTVTTKEYQVKLSCTYIVHTCVSCLVCSFWFRIRQCRNLNVDTHGLIHHHSNSNVLPPLQTCRHFHALGVRSRVFPDSCHGVWLWVWTGSAFPSRPQFSPVPLWSASLTWLLEHRAGHLSHMGWGTRIYWSTAIKSSLCLVWLEWFQLISGFHSSTLKWSHEACFGGHRPMVEWFQEVWLEWFPYRLKTWRLRKQKHSWFMNHLDLYNEMHNPEKNVFPTKSSTT